MRDVALSLAAIKIPETSYKIDFGDEEESGSKHERRSSGKPLRITEESGKNIIRTASSNASFNQGERSLQNTGGFSSVSENLFYNNADSETIERGRNLSSGLSFRKKDRFEPF